MEFSDKTKNRLLLLALTTCGGIIITLLIVLFVMEKRMYALGDTMDAMAEQHITRDIKVNDTIPLNSCLLYTSPSPRDNSGSRMPSSA